MLHSNEMVFASTTNNCDSNFLTSWDSCCSLGDLKQEPFPYSGIVAVKLELGICVVPPACLTFSTTPETEYPKTWTYLQNLQTQSLLWVWKSIIGPKQFMALRGNFVSAASFSKKTTFKVTTLLLVDRETLERIEGMRLAILRLLPTGHQSTSG